MRLSREFSEPARQILNVLMKEIPVVVDGLYAVAHDLAESGYRFHPDSYIPVDCAVVDGGLHRAVNQLFAENLHLIQGRPVNAIVVARQIAASGVYDCESQGCFAQPNQAI